MELEITKIGAEGWGRYAQVSPEFVVESVLECKPAGGGLGGIVLEERLVDTPYQKYGCDDNPQEWSRGFDLETWGIFLATIAGQPAGGAAVAPPSPGMVVTEGRKDAACLWDLRVSAADRRCGVGKALLARCAEWARKQGFRLLAIETQNVNVPACRFYAATGCELVDIRRSGYAGCPEFAHEAMLIWHLAL